MKTLVIVESPTKAKTITKFLSKDYIIKSSFGHVRDLPKNKLGVDVEHEFIPEYVVSKEKAAVVKELKAAAAKAKQVLFATDEDREGEAISYHLAAILDIDPAKAKRITFHEITKTAILEAMAHPRALDLHLVDAQQARRILDRLVGYNLSPFLWHKVTKGLSAGRVQSVAVRLVVEREREILAFKSDEYWTMEGTFEPIGGKKKKIVAQATNQGESSDNSSEHKYLTARHQFTAKLASINNKKIDKLDLKNKAQVDEILTHLAGAAYTITAVEKKQVKRTPPPPFTTSSLQQEANHQLGFSAKQTMRLAQQLYEGVELGSAGSIGLITYMRTDAVNLSQKFLQESKELIGSRYGHEYQLSEPRFFKNKSKGAQEAHEAIRPTEVSYHPDDVTAYLEKNQWKLYDLIWRRAVATQMATAELSAATIDLDGQTTSASPPTTYSFHATGQTITFDGFLKLYPEKAKENALPPLTTGQELDCHALKPEQHFTEPAGRYSDATLVKALEEFGIGRPSTYAPTIATIEDRGYVERDDKKKLFPKEIAYVVNDLLVEHFPQIVDFAFTAQMEGNLDAIAAGEKDWQPIIATFYHPFKTNLDQKDLELNKKELTEVKSDQVCDKCGKPMVIKLGRFGRFFACTGYPECKTTKPLPGEEKTLPRIEKSDQKCDKCGQDMLIKHGRYGPFLGCSDYPRCKNLKSIEIKMNLKCPKCKEGEVIEKRSKRKRIFYGCNRYPDCDFALWNKPTGELCPTCSAPLTFSTKSMVICSNKECGFKKEQE